jgi:phage tail sheath gpL-like
MPVTVLGLANSRKTPGVNASVILGGPGTSAGSAAMKVLLVGNMIAAALSGASPTFSVPAGTLQVGGTATEAPVQVLDSDDTKAKTGQGSELHRMAIAYFGQDTSAQVFVLPVAESAGARATGTLTFVGSATANGTIRAIVCGQPVDVAITNGDSVTQMATNVATAIVSQLPDLNVTAQFSAGVVTITAKHKGPRGNSITIRAKWINGSNEIAIATSTSQFGTACTISGATLSGGTTADTATNGITAIAGQKYDRIALSFTDTTAINLYAADMATKAGPTIQLWGQVIAATVSDPATAQTQSDAINDVNTQLCCLKNADNLTGEIAAQVAAARVNGDAMVGGGTYGENVDVATNLNGCRLKSILVQSTLADRATPAQIESMLAYGVTPLENDLEHPGFVKITASITTKHKDGQGAFTYAVYKTKIPTVSYFIANDIITDYRVTYKGFKLADDPADGSPIDIPRVITPSIVRARTLLKLKLYEAAGIITAVDSFASQVLFNINTSNRARLDGDIPEFPIPDCDIIGVNIRQLSL